MTERTPLDDPEFLRFYESRRWWSSACKDIAVLIYDWQRHPNVNLYGIHDPARQGGAEPDHFSAIMRGISDGLAVVRVGRREEWKVTESDVPNVPRLRSASRRAANTLSRDPVILRQGINDPLSTVAGTVVAYAMDHRGWSERLVAEDPSGGKLVYALSGDVMTTVKNAVRGLEAGGSRVNLMRPDDALPAVGSEDVYDDPNHRPELLSGLSLHQDASGSAGGGWVSEPEELSAGRQLRPAPVPIASRPASIREYAALVADPRWLVESAYYGDPADLVASQDAVRRIAAAYGQGGAAGRARVAEAFPGLVEEVKAAPNQTREARQSRVEEISESLPDMSKQHDQCLLYIYDSDKGEVGPVGRTDRDTMPPPASSSGEHATTGAGERQGTTPSGAAPVHDDPHERMTDVVERLGGAVLQTAPNTGFTYVRCPVSHGKRWSTAGIAPEGFVYHCNVCGSFDVAGLVAHVRGGSREEARAWVRSLGWELHEPGAGPVRHSDSDYQVNPNTPGQRDMFNIRRDTA